MADPNFFKKAGPYTLTQLAEMVGAKLVRCLDPDRIISDVATLDQAGADALVPRARLGGPGGRPGGGSVDRRFRDS